MPRFRKLPVEIDAILYTGDNEGAIAAFTGRVATFRQGVCTINTLEGQMRADVGDWIIKGVAGELYPCKPAIFRATYEQVA